MAESNFWQSRTGDIIWAQCVRCTDLTPEVRRKILMADKRGICFQMVINSIPRLTFRVPFWVTTSYAIIKLRPILVPQIIRRLTSKCYWTCKSPLYSAASASETSYLAASFPAR